jgi:hypothetical protein
MAKDKKMYNELLKQIVDATGAAPGYMFVSTVASQQFTAHNPPLVEVNPGVADPSDPTKLATRATDAAKDFLATVTTPAGNNAPAATAEPSKYHVEKGGFVPPPAKKRGGNLSGAPTKYPFATMEVNDWFFEPNSNHKKGDAVKALGSTISAQNRKYSEPTGETRTVTRAKRDPQTHKAIMENGVKVTETVSLPKLKYSRKFKITPVEAGKTYGTLVAPADGAVVYRSE